MSEKLVFVRSDNWVGVYKDGELQMQGHSVRARDVLSILGVEVEDVEPDPNWLIQLGRLPNKLEDVETYE